MARAFSDSGSPSCVKSKPTLRGVASITLRVELPRTSATSEGLKVTVSETTAERGSLVIEPCSPFVPSPGKAALMPLEKRSLSWRPWLTKIRCLVPIAWSKRKKILLVSSRRVLF